MTKNFRQIQKEAFSIDFEKFCKRKISARLRKLESSRKSDIGILVFIYLIAIGLFIGYLNVILPFFDTKNIDSNVFYANFKVVLGFVCAVSAIHYKFVKDFKNRAKTIVLPEILSYIGNFEIGDSEVGGIKFDNHIAFTNLFEHYNHCDCDDYLVGKYKNLDISIAELHLYNEKEYRDFNQTYIRRKFKYTTFKGLFFFISYPKKFEGITVVKKQGMKIYNNARRVKLEDIEFEKIYDVESTDQIEARYLLTPAFMDRMVKLSRRPIGKNGILVSFERGYINIAIPSNKDWFEIPFTKPVTDIRNYRAIVLDIVGILSIIDTLKLNEKQV